MLWRNAPDGAAQTTCVDLVFEPRTGAATLARAVGIGADVDSAAGVELITVAGRRLHIYWAPEAGPQQETNFADGAQLQGSLAVVADGEVAAVGATALRAGDKSCKFVTPVRRGTIVAVDRSDCSAVVDGIEGLAAGERIRINPGGRGHNYRVEAVEELAAGRCAIELDVTTLLGRARVAAVDGAQVELDFQVMARSGNLHGTRLEWDGSWAEIVEAHNPNADRTTVVLRQAAKGLEVGQWAAVVDCVVGDEVVYEPLGRSAW